MYKLEFSNGLKEKSNGFWFSISALSNIHVFVVIGIFKRFQWYISKKQVCLGYLFINFSGIKTLLK